MLTHPDVRPPAKKSEASHGRPHYIPDLDGTRALAVLGVLLFHLGVHAVPGGFAGVDVFYVISGFIITTLIMKQHGRKPILGLWSLVTVMAVAWLPA